MFKKVLVANRGEIAIRIIRAAKELGIKTVAIYSLADSESLHRFYADEAVCIGPGEPAESYLNMHAIITVAIEKGCDSIHPGYGFLAENPDFAKLCEDYNIKFIGPTREQIEKMGKKDEAKRIVKSYGVPVVPGSDGCVDINDPKLFKIVKQIGFPVIIKAAAGGGGKGMRIVKSFDELNTQIEVAKQEAKGAFGDDSVYIEKYLENPRHIEVQILGDKYGNVVSFPERDCTIQRRHQKLIEETPSPVINERLRKKLLKAARRAARAVKYLNAGTVEFIYKDGEFYFIEMNTRIQVEHTITEMITGIDLVKEQFRIAAGEKLEYDSDDLEIRGHAIQCRINAEDPENGFIPQAGTITKWIQPGGPGVRVDTHCYSGYTIPPYYDSLLAKVCVMGHRGRSVAIDRMKRVLGEFIVEGIPTTIPFHKKVLEHSVFNSSEYGTRFVEDYYGV